MKRYYSHGKLLITGEYVVLDGAKSLAIPTTFGQHMIVYETPNNLIHWISKDHTNEIWFEAVFKVSDNQFICTTSNNNSISDRLITIFNSAYQIDSKTKNKILGSKIETLLEFPNHWGLGTSSTLINNIASWLDIDPYKLLKLTFGGSGYDIACANASSGITFQIIKNNPHITAITFEPPFKSHLYFVYLNKKQDSREGIARYRNNACDHNALISEINGITEAMINCTTLDTFQELMEQHEDLIANCIQMKVVKKRLFPDFNGSVKSLGAWGGDFIMVASKTDPKSYFISKGYDTIISYQDMIFK